MGSALSAGWKVRKLDKERLLFTVWFGIGFVRNTNITIDVGSFIPILCCIGALGTLFGLYVGTKYMLFMLTGVWQGSLPCGLLPEEKSPTKNPKHTPSWEIYNLVGWLENKPQVTSLWWLQRHVPSHNLSNPASRKRELDDDAVPKAHRNSTPLL